MFGAQVLESILPEWYSASAPLLKRDMLRFLLRYRGAAEDLVENWLAKKPPSSKPWRIDRQLAGESWALELLTLEQARQGVETAWTAGLVERGLLRPRQTVTLSRVERVLRTIAGRFFTGKVSTEFSERAPRLAGALVEAVDRRVEQWGERAYQLLPQALADVSLVDLLVKVLRQGLGDVVRDPAARGGLALYLARNVFSPWALQEHPRRWRISLALNLRVDGEDIAAGPEEGLRALATDLHTLGYPTVDVQVRRAYKLGLPGGLDEPSAMRKRLEMLRLVGDPPADTLPPAWIAVLDSGGEVPLPDVDRFTRKLISLLSTSGVGTPNGSAFLGVPRVVWNASSKLPRSFTGWQTRILGLLPSDSGTLATDLGFEAPLGEALAEDICKYLKSRALVRRSGSRWELTSVGAPLGEAARESAT